MTFPNALLMSGQTQGQDFHLALFILLCHRCGCSKLPVNVISWRCTTVHLFDIIIIWEPTQRSAGYEYLHCMLRALLICFP